MYAKIVNDVVEKYPYSIGQLRKDNPNTSFPASPSDEQLAQWNVYRVARADQPKVNHTKEINESVPQKKNGVWTQVWTISDADAATIQARIADESDIVRLRRNALLRDSDWTQGKDIPDQTSAAWATYRTALRDIPEQNGFPWNVVWPIKPE